MLRFAWVKSDCLDKRAEDPNFTIETVWIIDERQGGEAKGEVAEAVSRCWRPRALARRAAGRGGAAGEGAAASRAG